MQHRLLSFVCILTSVDRATTPPDPRAVKIIATRTDAQRLCVRSVRLNWVSNSSIRLVPSARRVNTLRYLGRDVIALDVLVGPRDDRDSFRSRLNHVLITS